MNKFIELKDNETIIVTLSDRTRITINGDGTVSIMKLPPQKKHEAKQN